MSFFSSDLTRGKLILLYILAKTGFALSEEQLLRIVSKNEWLDYFSFQQALNQMHEGHLIAVDEGEKGNAIEINAAGQEMIEAFALRLPLSLREGIDAYAARNKLALRREAEFSASCEHIKQEEYMVSLCVLEQGRIIYENKILVFSHELAQTLCRRWPERGAEVYSATLELLGGRERTES